MASFAVIVATSVIGALAFSGANWGFNILEGHDTHYETIRHNLAVEKLNKATAEWNKKRAEQADWLYKRKQLQRHSEQTYGDVNTAMEEYNHYFGTNNKPVLSDFYTPSDFTTLDKELILIGGGLMSSYMLIKYFST